MCVCMHQEFFLLLVCSIKHISVMTLRWITAADIVWSWRSHCREMQSISDERRSQDLWVASTTALRRGSSNSSAQARTGARADPVWIQKWPLMSLSEQEQSEQSGQTVHGVAVCSCGSLHSESALTTSTGDNLSWWSPHTWKKQQHWEKDRSCLLIYGFVALKQVWWGRR